MKPSHLLVSLSLLAPSVNAISIFGVKFSLSSSSTTNIYKAPSYPKVPSYPKASVPKTVYIPVSQPAPPPPTTSITTATYKALDTASNADCRDPSDFRKDIYVVLPSAPAAKNSTTTTTTTTAAAEEATIYAIRTHWALTHHHHLRARLRAAGFNATHDDPRCGWTEAGTVRRLGVALGTLEYVTHAYDGQQQQPRFEVEAALDRIRKIVHGTYPVLEIGLVVGFAVGLPLLCAVGAVVSAGVKERGRRRSYLDDVEKGGQPPAYEA